MKSVPIRDVPKTVAEIEKFKKVVIRQIPTMEYKKFVMEYTQTQKGKWKLDGVVQITGHAKKNPQDYPDIADLWFDGKEHKLGSRTANTSSKELIRQICMEFKLAGKIGNTKITGYIEPVKKTCGCASLKRKPATGKAPTKKPSRTTKK